MDQECLALSDVEKLGNAGNINLDVEKSGVVGNKNLEDKIVCQTPEKTTGPLSSKSVEQEFKITEKHRAIVDLFDGMTCSLRLLHLSKKLPIFRNVCAQVEVLKKRNFSYKDLSQIKYVLPEAIQIDKILVHDQKTLCMKPELKITLLFDVIEGHHEQSDFVALRQVFDARLTSFFAWHLEDCDIPEAILPEPFSQRSQTTSDNQESCNIVNKQLPDSIDESLSTSTESEMLLESSLLHPSFNRFFSKEAVSTEATEKSTLLISTSLNKEDTEVAVLAELEEFPSSSSESVIVNDQDIEDQKLKESSDSWSRSTVNDPSIESMNPPCSISIVCKSPIQVLTTSDSSMIETPGQVTPKKLIPSTDDKPMNKDSQWKACNKSTKRSLDFTSVKGDKSTLSSTVDGSDYPTALIDEITQTTESKSLISENNLICSPESPKNQKASCLADLVPLIHRIFQSVNRTSITREELVHKIIINNLDIVERGEVEEQIELLEKLAPDWICRNLAPGGDILYNIRKFSDLNSVQARLVSS
ncbi:hypothetical protein SLEP1_g24829 [Rubroshorea leprosula]|uniref:CDT1 Geminin-binding domain-containing protein n=1 Tax=Rubroshorea leprosula TaxID=152421 RepID=A0AAV5JH43_9ROSI|nr:hypothetical protein SLEP1_g24829 [Rubroshorea leprosula]